MKKYLLIILRSIIPLIEGAGATLEAQDANDTGVDDIVGEGLVYGGELFQFLIDKTNGKDVTPPTVPSALANAQ